MSEPTTAAGQELSGIYPYLRGWLAAIEAEAREQGAAAERERLRAAVEALPTDAFGRVHDYAVLALLAEPTP